MREIDPLDGGPAQPDATALVDDASPPSVPAPQPAQAQVLPANTEADRLLSDLCGIKKPVLNDAQLLDWPAVDE